MSLAHIELTAFRTYVSLQHSGLFFLRGYLLSKNRDVSCVVVLVAIQSVQLRLERLDFAVSLSQQRTHLLHLQQCRRRTSDKCHQLMLVTCG